MWQLLAHALGVQIQLAQVLLPPHVVASQQARRKPSPEKLSPLMLVGNNQSNTLQNLPSTF